MYEFFHARDNEDSSLEGTVMTKWRSERKFSRRKLPAKLFGYATIYHILDIAQS
jgi:hypothetical protein